MGRVQIRKLPLGAVSELYPFTFTPHFNGRA